MDNNITNLKVDAITNVINNELILDEKGMIIIEGGPYIQK